MGLRFIKRQRLPYPLGSRFASKPFTLYRVPFTQSPTLRETAPHHTFHPVPLTFTPHPPLSYLRCARARKCLHAVSCAENVEEFFSGLPTINQTMGWGGLIMNVLPEGLEQIAFLGLC